MKLSKFIIILLYSLVFIYCKNPLEDVVIAIKDPISTSTVQLYYSNANGADTSRIPKNLKISIIGQDADKIVNSTGSKKISVSKEGLLGIAVSPDYTKRPIKFKVIAESDGYLTSVEDIELTGTNNISRAVRMLKINSLPSGLTLKTEISDSNTGTVLNTQSEGENAIATISKELTLYNSNLEVVSGKISWLLTYYNSAARNFVPSSYTFYNAIGLDNKVLKTFDFNAFCFFSLNAMNDKYEKVTSFSKPIEVNVELNENLIKLDNSKLKEGDNVPFWGYMNGVWKQFPSVTLKKNGKGKLEAKVSITEATYFAFGEMIEICDKGLSFTIKSPFSGMDTYYLAKFIDIKTGGQVRAFFTSFNNGTNVSVTGLRPYPNKVTMQLFNYNNHFGGDQNVPIFKSEPFDVCEDKKINVNVNIPQPQSVTLEITIKCPEGKVLDESQFPAAMQLQYQLSGSNVNNWTDLLTLTRTVRKVTTYKLKMGNKYNLRATTNAAQGWPFLQRDTTIKQDYFLLKLDGQGYCK